MARISGIDLPKDKRVVIGLTYIFGIGNKASQGIVTEAGISPDTKINQLIETEVASIRSGKNRNILNILLNFNIISFLRNLRISIGRLVSLILSIQIEQT